MPVGGADDTSECAKLVGVTGGALRSWKKAGKRLLAGTGGVGIFSPSPLCPFLSKEAMWMMRR